MWTLTYIHDVNGHVTELQYRLGASTRFLYVENGDNLVDIQTEFECEHKIEVVTVKHRYATQAQ